MKRALSGGGRPKVRESESIIGQFMLPARHVGCRILERVAIAPYRSSAATRMIDILRFQTGE
jgi:hypothetical protein